jgi:hypothetical protein
MEPDWVRLDMERVQVRGAEIQIRGGGDAKVSIIVYTREDARIDEVIHRLPAIARKTCVCYTGNSIALTIASDGKPFPHLRLNFTTLLFKLSMQRTRALCDTEDGLDEKSLRQEVQGDPVLWEDWHMNGSSIRSDGLLGGHYCYHSNELVGCQDEHLRNRLWGEYHYFAWLWYQEWLGDDPELLQLQKEVGCGGDTVRVGTLQFGPGAVDAGIVPTCRKRCRKA